MFTPLLPLSGVAGWRLLGETEALQREAHDTSVEIARDVEYFEENIASVRSADDLLADRRLLEVALTAYGLEDEIDKRAFIKLVLEGGTDDDSSFANSLSDSRWLDFAKGFGFGDAGSGSDIGGFEAAVAVKFRGDGEGTSGYLDPLDIAAFRTGIANVSSVEDLLADETVLNVALSAFGLERGYYTDAHFEQLLTEGVSDPASYANTLDDPLWASFAAAFEGLADGEPLQTVSQLQLDVERELERRGAGFETQEIADASSTKISADDLAYFQATVETMLSGADFTSDDRAMKVAMVAFGLTGDGLTNGEIETLIDSAIAGDFSVADAQSNYGWTLLAESFDTTVNGGSGARRSNFDYKIELGLAEENLEYIEAYDAPTEKAPTIDAEELSYFRENAKNYETGADLFADTRGLTVALTAFGLEDSSYSDSYLQAALEEDASDPNSIANITSDEKLAAFISAFNADSSGEGAASLWRLEIEDRMIAAEAPEEDLEYLRSNFNLIDNNLDFVLDPKLMEITMDAFGIDGSRYGSTFFVNVLFSDPADDRSFVNVLGHEGFKEMADVIGSYATVGGNTGLESFKNTVTERYKAKMFQLAVGEQDQSMRLALNFRDEVEEIANGASVETAGWYQIMGDGPMRAVLDGALGLPSQFAQLDVEDQVLVYQSRSRSLFGGEDPSVFKDTANLTRLIDLYLVGEAVGANPTGFTPGYGALSLMQSAASNARSFSVNV